MNRTALIHVAAVSALALIIAGCSTNKAKEDPYESGAYKTATENTNAPFKDDSPGLFDGLLGGDKKTQKKLDEQQKQIAELKNEIQRQSLQKEKGETGARTRQVATPPTAPGETRYAIGLYFPPATADNTLSAQFRAVLSTVSPDYPLHYTPSDKIADQLAASHCDLAHPSACADKLAIYPGVRVIAVVDSLEVTADGSQLQARIHLLDTLTHSTTVSREIRLPALDGKVTDRAWESLADNTLMSALSEARSAPWVAHAFSQDNGRWYLNAGAAQGIQAGDKLVVHAPGKIVRTPSGLAAGWVPGQSKGTLNVESVVSDTLSVATLVDGAPPAPEDPLLLAAQPKQSMTNAGATTAQPQTVESEKK